MAQPKTRSRGVLRVLGYLRRAVLAILGLQLAVAFGLTLVDSYRRRNNKPKPFPVAAPKTVLVGDGEITTYTFGQDLYDDMLTAIGQAKRSIMLESYIWKSDAIGQQFRDAVNDAAARGVSVHVIYDGFGSAVAAPGFFRFHPRVRVLRFPIYNAGWRALDLRRYGRDHRKILVVDGTVGFVGGYNIGDPYANEWRDTHVRITGPGVWDLSRAFADMWNLHRRRLFRPSEQPLLTETASEWEPRIRFHRNVPRLWVFPIRAMYLEAINRATRNVWMTHAYFIPDQDMVDALREAAGRGVDVRIVLPLKSNHVVADWISRGYYSQLLDAGVRILRFRDAMVHAKTSTIDGEWVTIGTANVDRLSLQGNYEINMEVIDSGLARVMEEVFAMDESHCWELHSEEWQARDFHRKFTEALLRPLRRLL